MNKITAEHLARAAYVYIRQSSPGQVQNNLEGQRRQFGLANRARELGWNDVEVIDTDLGISGSGTHRLGFARLMRAVCEGRVGAVFSVEASRLARNGRDWRTLLEFCSIVNVLLIDPDGVYVPKLTNDRLLLGMKGTISEMEVANFRECAQSALKQKAQRDELFARVPIGYVKSPGARVEKTPDARVRDAIEVRCGRSRRRSLRGAASVKPRPSCCRPSCPCRHPYRTCSPGPRRRSTGSRPAANRY